MRFRHAVHASCLLLAIGWLAHSRAEAQTILDYKASLEAGDVLLGRYERHPPKQIWGHWRHAAIYLGGGRIIEGGSGKDVAPMEPGRVQESSLESFLSRSYYDIIVVRARSGTRKMAPAARLVLRDGMTLNCADTVLYTYLQAIQLYPNRSFMLTPSLRRQYWFTPDGILNNGYFRYVGYVKLRNRTFTSSTRWLS